MKEEQYGAWEFKEGDLIVNEEKRYKLKLHKKIDKHTKERSLFILDATHPNGKVEKIRYELDIMGLEKSLIKLRKYDIAINKVDVINMTKLIDDNISHIEAREENELYFTTNQFKDIMDYIYEAMLIGKYTVDSSGYYNIPVKAFREIIVNSVDFSIINIKNLREQLKSTNVTKCVGDRTDTLYNDGTRRYRVIKFKCKKINKYYQEEMMVVEKKIAELKAPTEPVKQSA